MTNPTGQAARFWRRFAALFSDTLLVTVLNLPFPLVPGAPLIAPAAQLHRLRGAGA